MDERTAHKHFSAACFTGVWELLAARGHCEKVEDPEEKGLLKADLDALEAG